MARKEKKIPRLHLDGKSHEEKRVKYQCWNIKEQNSMRGPNINNCLRFSTYLAILPPTLKIEEEIKCEACLDFSQQV